MEKIRKFIALLQIDPWKFGFFSNGVPGGGARRRRQFGRARARLDGERGGTERGVHGELTKEAWRLGGGSTVGGGGERVTAELRRGGVGAPVVDEDDELARELHTKMGNRLATARWSLKRRRRR